jgi:hypothetical protein
LKKLEKAETNFGTFGEGLSKNLKVPIQSTKMKIFE